jgi:hypothetical protein
LIGTGEDDAGSGAVLVRTFYYYYYWQPQLDPVPQQLDFSSGAQQTSCS